MSGENASEDINLKATAGRDRDSRRDDDWGGGDRGNRRERRSKRDDDDSQSFTRVDFNVGAKQNVNPGRLMGVINEVMNNSAINFGKIEIDPNSSAIDVDSRFAADVAIALEGLRFGSKTLNVALGDRPLGGVGRPAKKGRSDKSGGFGKSGGGSYAKGRDGGRSGGKFGGKSGGKFGGGKKGRR